MSTSASASSASSTAAAAASHAATAAAASSAAASVPSSSSSAAAADDAHSGEMSAREMQEHYAPLLTSKRAAHAAVQARLVKQTRRLESMHAWKLRALEQAASEPHQLDFVLAQGGVPRQSTLVRAQRMMLQRTTTRSFLRTFRLLQGLRRVHTHMHALLPLMLTEQEQLRSPLQAHTSHALQDTLSHWTLDAPQLHGQRSPSPSSLQSRRQSASMAAASASSPATGAAPRLRPHSLTQQLLASLHSVVPLVSAGISDHVAAQRALERENYRCMLHSTELVERIQQVQAACHARRAHIADLRADVELIEAELRALRASYVASVESLETSTRAESGLLRRLNRMYYREVAEQLGPAYAVQLSLVQQGQPYNAVAPDPPPGPSAAALAKARSFGHAAQQPAGPPPQLFLPSSLQGTPLPVPPPSMPSFAPAARSSSRRGSRDDDSGASGGDSALPFVLLTPHTPLPNAQQPSVRIDRQNTLARLDALLQQKPVSSAEEVPYDAAAAEKYARSAEGDDHLAPFFVLQGQERERAPADSDADAHEEDGEDEDDDARADRSFERQRNDFQQLLEQEQQDEANAAAAEMGRREDEEEEEMDFYARQRQRKQEIMEAEAHAAQEEKEAASQAPYSFGSEAGAVAASPSPSPASSPLRARARPSSAYSYASVSSTAAPTTSTTAGASAGPARIAPLHARTLSEIDWSVQTGARGLHSEFGQVEKRPARPVPAHRPKLSWQSEALARQLQQDAERAAARSNSSGSAGGLPQQHDGPNVAAQAWWSAHPTPPVLSSSSTTTRGGSSPSPTRARPASAHVRNPSSSGQQQPLAPSPIPGLSAQTYASSFALAVTHLRALGYSEQAAMDFAPHVVQAGAISLPTAKEQQQYDGTQRASSSPPRHPSARSRSLTQSLGQVYASALGTSNRGGRPPHHPSQGSASARPPLAAPGAYAGSSAVVGAYSAPLARPGSAHPASSRPSRPSSSYTSRSQGTTRPGSAVSAARTQALVAGLPTTIATFTRTPPPPRPPARPATARPRPPSAAAGDSAKPKQLHSPQQAPAYAHSDSSPAFLLSPQ